MVETWFMDQISQPGSEYSNLKNEVEDFNSEFLEAISTIKEQDRDRNLGNLEKAPTSLMDYPKFKGQDSQCYFKLEVKMIRALKTNRFPIPSFVHPQVSGHCLSSAHNP